MKIYFLEHIDDRDTIERKYFLSPDKALDFFYKYLMEIHKDDGTESINELTIHYDKPKILAYYRSGLASTIIIYECDTED